MFTGIIEETGIIRSIVHKQTASEITIGASVVCDQTKEGESISVNGVCLTVTKCTADGFTADVMKETLLRSTLGLLQKRSVVNLERALTLSSRLGGHMVSGHIDGTGIIDTIKTEGIALVYSITCDTSLLRYIIPKGSVALDGISLTVCTVTPLFFSVSVIPHTRVKTILEEKKKGDALNIECDMIAKYVEKFAIQKEIINESFLMMNGF